MRNMPSYIWLVVLFALCAAADFIPDTPSRDSSDEDAAILRNALSNLPRSHLLTAGLSTFRLHQMASWLGRAHPHWHVLSHNTLYSLLSRWHHWPSKGQSPTDVPPKESQRPVDFRTWYKAWLQDDVGECGIPDVEPRLKMPRIIGGNNAIPGSWPWMVSLKFAEQHWCGGVLLDKQWVLSAGHCFYGWPVFSNLSLWEARLGKFDPTPGAKTEPTQQNIKLINIFTPPGFDVNDTLLPGKDLVLLKLERPVTMNTWTRPLCLPNNDDIPSTGQKCVITGWGSITPSGPPGALKEAVVPVYSYSDCSELPGYKELVTEDTICAGYREGGVDTCHGDSGGPLQCQIKNRWVMAGTTSFGDAGGSGCATPLRPGVYTLTASHVEWIHRVLYRDYRATFREHQ
ncbi:serine protease 33-like isoform X1 [Haliotis rufescens]|uniref:serine protease 33-like isoform X1 n=1 Tax=Haliotis rufescens TaxID=6454 RepID=UPI00201F655A|nr:serine protease 33-like isoform X1 [Haliotis rufescens]